MSTRHDNADGPEDIDAAFAEIVAGLERDSTFGSWPREDEPRRTEEDDAARPEPAPAPEPASGPRDWTPEVDEADEHYVPPEPPPLPKPGWGTVAGVAVVCLGVVLLALPALVGPSTLPIGLVLISAGIGWLLLRIRNRPGPDADDEDGGAQV
ncbi:DUF308 domain-containing protein [Saccharopolyspora sp. CA-218241]|uniref:DUF308 domain-containing protein n=1 Tax=Saccharopolyspora sp. CA-218241 TaxID=3240027 RepID=UPI003D981531